MTILSPETLISFLDIMATGASVTEATAAIGAAPKSKIVFAWLKDSEQAGEFDPPPDVASPWCVEFNGTLDWFHLHYRRVQADARAERAAHPTPMRADLEALLAKKRMVASPLTTPPAPPPRPRDDVRTPVMIKPAPPPNRPSYAFRRAPPLCTVDRDGPPSEGRFVVATHRYSKAERRAGTVEVTDEGIRKW